MTTTTIDVIHDGAPTLAWFVDPIDDSAEGELADSVVVALGTDRLADISDILPNLNDDDRRGWWGDYDAELIHEGWPIGTRLWILARAKILGPGAREGATVAKVRAYLLETIHPYIEQRIATRHEIHVDRVDIERIDARVVLYRGNASIIDLRYAGLWSLIVA